MSPMYIKFAATSVFFLSNLTMNTLNTIDPISHKFFCLDPLCAYNVNCQLNSCWLLCTSFPGIQVSFAAAYLYIRCSLSLLYCVLPLLLRTHSTNPVRRFLQCSCRQVDFLFQVSCYTFLTSIHPYKYSISI